MNLLFNLEKLEKLLLKYYPNFESSCESHYWFTTYGDKEYSFNQFIKSEIEECSNSGDGATYVVCNKELNKTTGQWEVLDIVGYYTLAATSIPYEDRIREVDDEGNPSLDEDGNPFYNSKICGISAIELKMFAIDQKYQDMFYQSDDEDMPIAAWVLNSIVEEIKTIISSVIGAKAIFLRSVPGAEYFYERNGFHEMKPNMMPLYCVDAECKPMYYMLKEVHINFEE